MNFLKLLFFKKISLINYIIIFLFLIYSILITRYQYDGHHIGLIYSNSLDLLNGKLPYKEIFIQYGILTTLINSFILLIFDNKLFFIIIFNSIFYSLGILFISKIVKNLTNLKLSLLSTIIILFNHPIPWLPWPNYIVFFFISISFYFLTANKKNFFLFGLFLGLSVLTRQDFFLSILFSFLTFNFLFFLKKYKFYFKDFMVSAAGFLLPLIIFMLYLLSFNLFDYWFNYLSLPNIYLEIYETSASKLIIEYIIFFITESFYSFIITPQYFLISIILILNSIILFLFIFNKAKISKEILFILIVANFSSATALKIELFRLYTSVIFGLIVLLCVFDRIQNKDLRKNMLLLLFLPSLFSICFYPMGNNHFFKKINFTVPDEKVINSNFNYYVMPEQKIKIFNKINDLSQKCDVGYLENLTWDTLYSTVAKYDRIRVTPYAQFKKKNYKLVDLIETKKGSNLSFINLINKEISNSNIILLISDNNYFYKNDKIQITPNYKMFKIDQENVMGKPKILRIYFPKKCII